MFSNIFGKGNKETRKVVVTRTFVEEDVDMGGMDRSVTVRAGETGVATIGKSGTVSIKMDNVQDPVFSRKMTANFKNESEMSGRFKFVQEHKVTLDEREE